MGVGNVTELLDTDSVGANALLSGIGMELGASVLFTVEESGKTIGSVHELNVSSKMMFLAKSRGSIPKDLGIDLLILKDKRKERNNPGRNGRTHNSRGRGLQFTRTPLAVSRYQSKMVSYK